MSKTRLLVSFATIALTLAVAGRYTVWAFPLIGSAPVVEAVAADAQQPPAARLQAGERPPAKIKDVRPVYPEEAMKARVQGVVILEVTIETDGTVSDAKVMRSVPMLNQAALDAVRQWRFAPRDHRLIMTVTVSFRLDDEAGEKVQADRPRPPVKIRDVRPQYPEDARKARVEGVVIMQVTIDAEGAVSAAKVLRSVPMLDQAALDAVRQWRFAPPDRETQFTVSVAFRLDAKTAGEPEAPDESQVTMRIIPLPRILREVKPRYPPELLKTGGEGIVEVRLLIDATGAVADVTVLSGPEGFHQAAIDAVRQWRFEPPETQTIIDAELTFTVRNRPEPASLFGPGAAPVPAGPGLTPIRFKIGG